MVPETIECSPDLTGNGSNCQHIQIAELFTGFKLEIFLRNIASANNTDLDG
jgi:hypothetical protein